jgi:GDPmannose 4,6-dehydratase
MKKAFITGITGQDGSFLTELLISKGYEVHGLVRRTSVMQRSRLDQLNIAAEQRKDLLHLHYGDLSEGGSLSRLLHQIVPNEIYHLGGQSHVKVSFESPESTFDVNAVGALRLLECLRDMDLPAKFYNASTSEMYGHPNVSPQDENTPLAPISPYACSKAAAHFLTVCYRESYGLFACNGILFNHESPRRGENFVTRKISRGAAAIKLGKQNELLLGTLTGKKDWGYAPEYVEAMWLMLQQEKPEDFVIASGESHSVQEFVELSFQRVGLDWKKYVKTDPSQLRPSEVGAVVGNASKAQKVLGWKPRTRFQDLVNIMVDSELSVLSGK